MADDKTTVTELATALGTLGESTVGWAILQRPAAVLIAPAQWEQLESAFGDPALAALAETAFDNGAVFARHRDALAGRRPERIEWTGGRRPPGDQVIPADLRIDRVYLVSCKYSSKVLHNASPGRVFDHALSAGESHERADWFDVVAPVEHAALARAAASGVGCSFPAGSPSAASVVDRRRLRDALRELGRSWPDGVAPLYAELCRVVSEASAARWRAAAPTKAARELLLWRILRLASAPYFVVGTAGTATMRFRIDTPWDWRQRFELRRFDVEADRVGQPQVRWRATVADRTAGLDRTIEGHVQVRWSHGRFGGPPEAKVYLDTPHADVAGYVALT